MHSVYSFKFKLLATRRQQRKPLQSFLTFLNIISSLFVIIIMGKKRKFPDSLQEELEEDWYLVARFFTC